MTRERPEAEPQTECEAESETERDAESHVAIGSLRSVPKETDGYRHSQATLIDITESLNHESGPRR